MKSTLSKQIQAQVNSFPGMPGAATKLLAMCENTDATIPEMEEILRYDPGLTANVLKLTNSAYIGLPAKVASLKQAMMMLGVKKITQLVITSCVSSLMNKPVPGYGLPPGELWRHSVTVSIAAEGLVQELKLEKADEIFTAALLHDVGKLVLGHFVKEDLEKLDEAADEETSFEVAEKSVLGTDHAEIGAIILKKWDFPNSLVNAVRWHHHPDAAGESNAIIDVVHVANVLSLMMGIGVGREGLQYVPWKSATQRLGLHQKHLEAVASRTLQSVAELSDMLNA